MVGGGGVQSHFHVQPDCHVGVVVCCVFVGVVTKVCIELYSKRSQMRVND